MLRSRYAVRLFVQRLVLALCCLAVSWNTPLVATDDPLPAADSAATLRDRIRAHDARLERRIVGLRGAHLGYPRGASGSIGAILARVPEKADCTSICDFRGPFAQLEPGLNGAQLSFGYGVVMGEKKPANRFVSRVYLSYGIKGALLRTWGNATLDPADQTLVGAVSFATLTQVNLQLGLFRSVTGRASEEPWRIAGSVGWGF